MNNKKAFTLIELLVVITVIALLVSILMPALSKAKESAKKTVCAGNMKSIGQGFMIYTASNNDKIPHNDNPDKDDPTITTQAQKDNFQYDHTGTDTGTHLTYMMFKIERDLSLAPKDRIGVRYPMGLLYSKRYIDTPETFYCPGSQWKRQDLGSQEYSLAFDYKSYSTPSFPWTPDDMINNLQVRSSYHLIPQSGKKKAWIPIAHNSTLEGYTYTAADAINDGGFVNGNQEKFPEIAKNTSELTGYFAIGSGLIHLKTNIPHSSKQNKSQSSSGINVLMGDCSVKFSNTRAAFDSKLWDVENLGAYEYPFRKLLSLIER